MTHPPAPLRPVSDDHRHEPADYELEPNELAACPNPWCESHKRPERGYVPFISKNRASSELRVACPVCPMSGPWADTEAEARKAWNQRSSLATRPDTKPTGDMREALEAADYEWRGPYGQEKHRIIPPVLFDRILTALTQAPRACCAEERERCAKIADDVAHFARRGSISPYAAEPDKLAMKAEAAEQIATAIRSNSHD